MKSIKQFLNSLYFIIAGVLVSVIYLFVNKNKKLKSELNQAKVEKELGEIINLKDEALRSADEEEAKYRSIRDEFLKPDPNDSGPGAA